MAMIVTGLASVIKSDSVFVCEQGIQKSKTIDKLVWKSCRVILHLVFYVDQNCVIS